MIFLTLEKILVEDVYDSYYESYFLKGYIDENADEGVVYMVSMISLVIIMIISQIQTIIFGYRVPGMRQAYSRKAFVMFLLLTMFGLTIVFLHYFLPESKMSSYIMISALNIIIPLALVLYNTNVMDYIKLNVKRKFCTTF